MEYRLKLGLIGSEYLDELKTLAGDIYTTEFRIMTSVMCHLHKNYPENFKKKKD